MDKYYQLANRSFGTKLGKVVKVVGLTVESIGPTAKLNDLCQIISLDGTVKVDAEVIGFRDDRVLLMPFGETTGVGPGSRVENTGEPLKIPVCDELLGKTLDSDEIITLPDDCKSLNRNVMIWGASGSR